MLCSSSHLIVWILGDANPLLRKPKGYEPISLATSALQLEVDSILDRRPCAWHRKFISELAASQSLRRTMSCVDGGGVFLQPRVALQWENRAKVDVYPNPVAFLAASEMLRCSPDRGPDVIDSDMESMVTYF
jgi:hypothetical protein